ncbi:MAG TPA: class I SAM-dependent methyltransferase [Mizugakiibacter sp.]
MAAALQTLVTALEQDCSLDAPERLRERIAVIDRLDAWLADGAASADAAAAYARARALHVRLEAANRRLYDEIREAIRRGTGRGPLLRWARTLAHGDSAHGGSSGDSYDALDELVSGVLQLDPPEAEVAAPPDGMVFYQPTPARHVFALVERAALSERDVLVDLGAGLGHVPLLAAICSGARGIGIEREAAYVASARRCAAALNLANVAFIEQDARDADLTEGTVFYLYTPFAGAILRRVLDALRHEAERRAVRVCTFGPCTPVVAEEPWLMADGATRTDTLALFRSR